MIYKCEWRNLPIEMGKDEHVFIMGDVHGRFDAMNEMVNYLEKVNSSPKKTRFVSLGDLIDRGPRSIDCLRLLSELDTRYDHLTLLPGNHELMMTETFRDHTLFRLWFRNGGSKVFEEVDPDGILSLHETIDEIEKRFNGLLNHCFSEPYIHYQDKELLTVHAGVHPLFGLKNDHRHESWAWVREPFLEHTGGWDKFDCKLIVHGHTAVTWKPLVSFEEMDGTFPTHGRICLDVGAAVIEQVAVMEILDGAYRLHVRVP